MNLKTTLRLYLYDFFLFLKNPTQRPAETRSLISRATRFWMAYFTELCIAVVISIPLIYLADKFLLRLHLNDGFTSMDNLFVAIIFMVLLAPVLEELLFRYPLRFIRPRFLKLAVYISSVLFGLVHLGNYENNQWLFYVLAPIIVSSQSLGGFVLAYLRLREGLLWSMFAHALFNATVILFSVIFDQGLVRLNEQNERYSLTVKEYSFKQGKQVREIYRSGERIDSIVWKQASLQALVDSLSDKSLKADQTLVDVEFNTVGHPIATDSVLVLLRKEFRIE